MSSNDDDLTKIPLITHINQLPNEILVHIFSISDYEQDNYSFLLSLACVCGHWRDVLWSSPQFWTSQTCTIHTKLRNDGPHSALLRRLCDHFEKWYGRAGNVPRELSLSIEGACRKTPALYKYLTGGTRWRTLSFSFGVKHHWTWLGGLISSSNKPFWPDLTTFEVIAPSSTLNPRSLALPFGYSAPNLMHLKIHIFEIGFDTSITSVFSSSPNPFSNLTTFDFEGGLTAGRHPESQSVALCMYLLSTAPNLQVLRVLDGQGLADDVAIPGQYARLVPLKHKALRELTLHWNRHSATFLTNVALPRLEMLDLANLWVAYDHWSMVVLSRFPTLASTLNLLILNSAKAASGMGILFSLKRLSLKRIMLGADDRYEVIMQVRDMVEELALDCSPCSLHEPPELFERLDKWVNGSIETAGENSTGVRKVAMEPPALFPNLNLFTAVTNKKSRLLFTVSRADPDEYTTFETSPLTWWGKCQVALDKAEALR